MRQIPWPPVCSSYTFRFVATCLLLRNGVASSWPRAIDKRGWSGCCSKCVNDSRAPTSGKQHSGQRRCSACCRGPSPSFALDKFTKRDKRGWSGCCSKCANYSPGPTHGEQRAGWRGCSACCRDCSAWFGPVFAAGTTRAPGYRMGML